MAVALSGLPLAVAPVPLRAVQDVTPDTAPQPTARTALTLAARCVAPARSSDPVVSAVAEAILAGPERLGAVVDSLEGDLRARGAADAHDAEARYRLAVVLGGRVETLEGRDRVEAAEALYQQAQHVLEVAPDHAGTHHLMGRLMAGVLRLGGFTRAMARMVAGGDLLGDATWPVARSHLEHAEQDAPCVPEHHLELAKLLEERGDAEAARRELRHVLELVSSGHGTRIAGIRERALVMLRRPSG